MKIDSDTISWIFLSIALGSQEEPIDAKGISLIADGINHAIPTQQELNTSIKWLIKLSLISQNGGNYFLTPKGVSIFKTASARTVLGTLKNIPANLPSKI